MERQAYLDAARERRREAGTARDDRPLRDLTKDLDDINRQLGPGP